MSTRGSMAARSSTGSEEQEVVVNGVFLSPRVVDRRAYGELAEDLRELVRQAATERSAITGMLDQAGRANQELRQREQQQQSNIELTARALKMMDDRAGRIERLLAQATEQSRVFEGLESQATSLIDGKIKSLEARLEAATAGAAAQAEALEERVRRASRELEQRIEAIRRDAQSIAGPAQAALERASDRAAAMAGNGVGSLGDLVVRGERVVETAGSIASTLESATARVERDRASIIEIEQKGLELERTLGGMHARLAQQQAESVGLAQEAIDGVRLMLAQVREQTTMIRGEGAGAVAELRAIIQQSIDAHNTTSLAVKVLGKSIEQAKGITDALEPWRAVLDGHEPGGMPEPVRRLIEGVRSELTGELAGIAGALRAAADRAERTGRALASVPAESAAPLPAIPAIERPQSKPEVHVMSVKPQSHPLVAGKVRTPPNMPEPDQIIGR